MPTAIDVSAFEKPANGREVRESVGISPDALVIGNVGRLHAQKNHKFFLQVAREIAQRERDVTFLLIGDGPLRKDIEREIQDSNLADNFMLLGTRYDVPALLRAMDVLLFPSLYEGFGRVALEAQLAGVPAVVSEAVPVDADQIPQLVTRLSLTEPESIWANAVLTAAKQNPQVEQRHCFEVIKASRFNMQVLAKELEQVYAGPNSAATPHPAAAAT